MYTYQVFGNVIIANNNEIRSLFAEKQWKDVKTL